MSLGEDILTLITSICTEAYKGGYMKEILLLVCYSLVVFTLGGLLWPWVMSQLQKFFQKND